MLFHGADYFIKAHVTGDVYTYSSAHKLLTPQLIIQKVWTSALNTGKTYSQVGRFPKTSWYMCPVNLGICSKKREYVKIWFLNE